MPLRSPEARNSLFVAMLIAAVCLLPRAALASPRAVLINVAISAGKSGVELRLKGKPSKASAHTLSDPSRLVIDLADTSIGRIAKKLKVEQMGLSEIRIGQQTSVARIVFDFGKNPVPAHRLQQVAGGYFVELGKRSDPAPQKANDKGASVVPQPGAAPAPAPSHRTKTPLSKWLQEDSEPVPVGTAIPPPDDVATMLDPEEKIREWGQAASAPARRSERQEEHARLASSASQPPMSSQGAAPTSPPVAIPQREVSPTQRGQQPQASSSPQIPDLRRPGAVSQIPQQTPRPPVVPPEPPPRLVKEEITDLKFQQVGHASRLWLKAFPHLDYRVVKVSATKLKIDLINAEIPKPYQKPLRTDQWSTSVDLIIPGSQHIFIQMKQAVPYKVEMKSGILTVDFPPPRLEVPKNQSSTQRPGQGASAGQQKTPGGNGEAKKDEDCDNSLECQRKTLATLDSEREKLRSYLSEPSNELLNKPLTMDFQDISVKNAVRLLSEISGVNITVDKDVTGTVTMKLQDVPVKDAIKTILISSDLDMVMIGDVMRIGQRKTIQDFRKEKDEKIKQLDRMIDGVKNKIRSLEAKKQREEAPGGGINLTDATKVGEAECVRFGAEEICFEREVVRLHYADPQAIVTILECMFNEKCKKEGQGVSPSSLDAERQKAMDAEKAKLAQQGFTPDSPGGESRLAAAAQQVLEKQRTDISAAAAAPKDIGPGPTSVGDTRTKLIRAKSSLWADDKYRRVFIKDTPDRIAQMKEVIKSLDTPQAQVLIETRIVEASRSWGRTLGIMWGGRNNQYGGIENNKQAYWGFTGNQGRATYTQPTDAPGGPQRDVPPGGVGAGNTATGRSIQNATPPSFFGLSSSPMRNNIPSTYAVNLPARGFTLNPSLLTDVMGLGMQFGLLAPQYLTELDMRIQMGEGTGQAKTIAKPKVQVLDRQKASILRGTEIPYLSTSQQQGTQVQFKNAVLQLEVTPTIYSSGRIGMKLNVKDDFPDPSLTVQGNPAIGKREAETNMEVNDGETAVIGGILRDRALQNREGWPGLMNIPLIGYLFSSKVKEKTLDELLIFITPTIVKRPPKAS